MMNDREARERIIQAIASSSYRWRSARGIAKDAGVSIQQVIDVVERSDAFIRAKKANAKGEALYTTKHKYRSETSWYGRVLSALTNKITE